jgi:hypothetical protein
VIVAWPRRTAACLALLVGINLLVVAKYGVRAPVSVVWLAIGYILAVAAGTWAWLRWGRRLPEGWDTALTVVLVAAFALLAVDLLARIEPRAVRVDRWSAMTAFNDRLLSGRFPYEARTHLGSRVSGLPVLFAIGLPFQLAGDVGYLQPVAFAAFVGALFAMAGRRASLWWPVVLLGASPVFLWEVAVRSDLLSNAALAVLFLVLCERWRGRPTAARVVVVAALGGLCLGTRLALAVPFIVYFVGYFRGAWRTGLAAAAGALAVFVATLLPFAAWNWTSFLVNNPLAWQASLSPAPVQVAAALMAVAAGLGAKDLAAAAFRGGAILAASVATAFALAALRGGFAQALWGTGFDISYFDLAVPFLIVPLCHVWAAPTASPCAIEDGA